MKRALGPEPHDEAGAGTGGGGSGAASLDLDSLARTLSSRSRLSFRRDGYRPAAVLVPVVVERALPERVVLTVRPVDLPTHAGQIAFPGGKCEPGDLDAIATALREAEEEVGIEPASVRVVGLLDDVPTPSGFVITPVVAWLEGPLALRPSHEVAETFFADVPHLRAPRTHRIDGSREFLGGVYAMHEYRVGERVVWGATARILWQLLELSAGRAGTEP